MTPLVLSYGGGANSTAVLCGLKEKQLPWPDLILFADTAGEHPETYQYIAILTKWLIDSGAPPITCCRWESKTYRDLEEQCNVTGMLPSPAYGGHSCSIRWKQDAMHKYLKSWPAIRAWESGTKVKKIIGYDRDEKGRSGAAITEDDDYVYEFPLIAWRWTRGHCYEAIERAGLPPPVKSSCFYCPSKKKKEVFALYRDHPDLYERAVAMEENAEARKDIEGRKDGTKGLGRRWSWNELINGHPDQIKMWPDPPPIPCICRDETPAPRATPADQDNK